MSAIYEDYTERDRMLPHSTPLSVSHHHHQQQQPGFPQSSSAPAVPTTPTHHRRSFHAHDFAQIQMQAQGQQPPMRNPSFKSHPSSPLNPSQQQPVARSPSSSSHGASSYSQQQQQQPPPPPLLPIQSPFGRPGSRGSLNFSRIPSDFGGMLGSGGRGSMILYRRADGMPPGSGASTPTHIPSHAPFPISLQPNHTGTSYDGKDGGGNGGGTLLPPPPLSSFAANRGSVYSTSGDSFISMASDSKYPASITNVYGHGGGYGTSGTARGLVAYAYDPDEDDDSEDDGDDWLHDPDVEYPGSRGTSSSRKTSTSTRASGKAPAAGANPHPNRLTKAPGTGGGGGGQPKYRPPRGISLRGLVNISTLIAMVAAMLCLFVVYPMVKYFADEGVNARITGNLRINATGQAEYADEDLPGTPTESGTGTGGTPTKPRISTTVTAINQGGLDGIERRWWSWGGERKRRGRRGVEDEWVLEYPKPSHDLHLEGESEYRDEFEFWKAPEDWSGVDDEDSSVSPVSPIPPPNSPVENENEDSSSSDVKTRPQKESSSQSQSQSQSQTRPLPLPPLSRVIVVEKLRPVKRPESSISMWRWRWRWRWGVVKGWFGVGGRERGPEWGRVKMDGIEWVKDDGEDAWDVPVARWRREKGKGGVGCVGRDGEERQRLKKEQERES